jgi:hypothetical protein
VISDKSFEALIQKARAGERDWSKLIRSSEYSVELMWRLYRAVVLPAVVSETQQTETRTAFVAGYIEGFKGVTEFAAALTEDDAVKFLTSLQRECSEQVDKLLAMKRGSR